MNAFMAKQSELLGAVLPGWRRRFADDIFAARLFHALPGSAFTCLRCSKDYSSLPHAEPAAFGATALSWFRCDLAGEACDDLEAAPAGQVASFYLLDLGLAFAPRHGDCLVFDGSLRHCSKRLAGLADVYGVACFTSLEVLDAGYRAEAQYAATGVHPPKHQRGAQILGGRVVRLSGLRFT